MTSHEVKKYYNDGKISDLYKIFKKYFDLIDFWADKMVDGDLLSEEELKYAMQQVNGSQTKINPVAGALEAMVIEYENNYILEEEKKFTNVRVQDKDHCKAYARANVSDLRRYASDFTRYSYSAQSVVVTAQSLLKRFVVEKSNKEIAYSGEVPVDHEHNKHWDE